MLRNEYLAAENEILKSKIEGRPRLNDEERVRLVKIGERLGRKALGEIGTIVKPDTILEWFRDLVAKKFDGSKKSSYPGRPRVDPDVEKLVVEMAEANPTQGYDRIQGALANLGHEVSDQSIGNILKRHGIPPAPTRSRNTTWADFIRTHADSIVATDFFTAEVLTAGGPVTFYVLFFLHLASRRVRIAGITEHPTEQWMMQMARNWAMADYGFLEGRRYLIHDRDTKYCAAFRNPFAERWVRSIKNEAISRLVFFSKEALRRAAGQYLRHYHEERNHQGLGNRLLFPRRGATETQGKIVTEERLGGRLRFYYREAA